MGVNAQQKLEQGIINPHLKFPSEISASSKALHCNAFKFFLRLILKKSCLSQHYLLRRKTNTD